MWHVSHLLLSYMVELEKAALKRSIWSHFMHIDPEVSPVVLLLGNIA